MQWMKRIALLVGLAVALVFVGVTPSRADGWHGHEGHGHGHYRGGWYGHGWYGRGWYGPRIAIGVGPFGWGTGFWWGGPGPYVGWRSPYYAAPPVVIQQSPPVYIQRPEPPPAPPSYWYYCPSRRGYYPTVPSCPEPWVKVPPNGD